LKTAYDSVTRDGQYSTLSEFGTLIHMNSQKVRNEIYVKFGMYKKMMCFISSLERFKKGTFVATEEN